MYRAQQFGITIIMMITRNAAITTPSNVVAYFIFGRSPIQISARRPVILTGY
jgi:hypothetical protein